MWFILPVFTVQGVLSHQSSSLRNCITSRWNLPILIRLIWDKDSYRSIECTFRAKLWGVWCLTINSNSSGNVDFGAEWATFIYKVGPTGTCETYYVRTLCPWLWVICAKLRNFTRLNKDGLYLAKTLPSNRGVAMRDLTPPLAYDSVGKWALSTWQISKRLIIRKVA